MHFFMHYAFAIRMQRPFHALGWSTMITLLSCGLALAHQAPANDQGCHLDGESYHCHGDPPGTHPRLRGAADLDCSDFRNQLFAQLFFEGNHPVDDPHGLDGDRDYLACETGARPLSSVLNLARQQGWDKPKTDNQ